MPHLRAAQPVGVVMSPAGWDWRRVSFHVVVSLDHTNRVFEGGLTADNVAKPSPASSRASHGDINRNCGSRAISPP